MNIAPIALVFLIAAEVPTPTPSPTPTPTPTTAPAAAAAPGALRDLGGRTWRGEQDSFKVTIAAWEGTVRVFLTTPGLITTAMDVCLGELAIGVAADLVCDHGRKVSLRPTARGYQVTLGGTLVTEARAYLGAGQYGPQGPIVYDTVAVSPVEVAFLTPEFFKAPDRVGNSSPETQVLASILPRPRAPSAAETRRQIEAVLEREGIDPLTVPLPVVQRLQREVAEARALDALDDGDRSTTRLLRVLDETARRAVLPVVATPAATTP